MEKKVILITGASSGFGFDACKMLKEKGHIVYGVARREDKLKELDSLGINTYKLDVTDFNESKKVVSEIIQKEGRIDVLINNAGYGQLGPIEITSMEEAKKQMEVNVFAMANMSKLVIPIMRENKRGRIINISSVAGKVPVYFGGWYNISKFSVEALSDNLRLDLKKFGIDVTLIEPGPFKTNWGIIAGENILKTTKDTPYEEDGKLVSKFYLDSYSKKKSFVKDGSIVSKLLVKVSLKRRTKARYLVGGLSKFMLCMYRILPTKLFDKILIKFNK